MSTLYDVIDLRTNERLLRTGEQAAAERLYGEDPRYRALVSIPGDPAARMVSPQEVLDFLHGGEATGRKGDFEPYSLAREWADRHGLALMAEQEWYGGRSARPDESQREDERNGDSR